MNALAARRRHPAAIALLLLAGLIVTGVGLRGPRTARRPRPPRPAADQVEEGKKLFLANCSTCHGLERRRAPGRPQPRRRRRRRRGLPGGHRPYAAGHARRAGAPQEGRQVHRRADRRDGRLCGLAGPRARHPRCGSTPRARRQRRPGGELFRVNCAMCHNFAGSGGALTRGKYAPSLRNIEGKHIYEAMVTGPQSMPVFNDTNISPESKNDIVAYLHSSTSRRTPAGWRSVTWGLCPRDFRLGLRSRDHDRLCRLARAEIRLMSTDGHCDRIDHTMNETHEPSRAGSRLPTRPARATSRARRPPPRFEDPGLPPHVPRTPTSTRRPPSAPRSRSPRSSGSPCSAPRLHRGVLRDPDRDAGLPARHRQGQHLQRRPRCLARPCAARHRRRGGPLGQDPDARHRVGRGAPPPALGRRGPRRGSSARCSWTAATRRSSAAAH